jgi:hypothetical protein
MGSVQWIHSAVFPSEMTPHYAPLEFYPPDQRPSDYAQRPDLTPGTASDRYMLGATLFALACGREAESIHEETGLPIVVKATDRAEGTTQMRLGAMRPELARSFTVWVDDALNLLPEDRFSSHEEARKALKSGTRALSNASEAKIEGRKRRGQRKPLSLWPQRFPLSERIVIFVIVAGGLLAIHQRYPSAFTRPWQWPKLMMADVALHRGNPKAAMNRLASAQSNEWEAQILTAKAQLALNAPENALHRMKLLAARPEAPPRVTEALEEVKEEAGQQLLYKGLRLLEKGDSYPAYLSLQKASQLGQHTPKGDWALYQLSASRGKQKDAKNYLDLYLKAKPNSVKGQLTAAQAALAREQWTVAQAHALRAKQLAAQPQEKQEDPVAADRLDRVLSRVASAILSGVPDNPSHLRSQSGLQGRIERLLTARTLKPSAERDRQLARYYERLADIQTGPNRALLYGKACDVLRNSQAKYGANSASATLLARCQSKLQKTSG